MAIKVSFNRELQTGVLSGRQDAMPLALPVSEARPTAARRAAAAEMERMVSV